jgi:hypothetical protein
MILKNILNLFSLLVWLAIGVLLTFFLDRWNDMLRRWLLLSIMISKDLKLSFDSCAWQLEFHLIIKGIDIQAISRLLDVVKVRDGRHGILLSR